MQFVLVEGCSSFRRISGTKKTPQHVYFMYLGPRKLYKKAPGDTYMMSNLCKIKIKRNNVTVVLL